MLISDLQAFGVEWAQMASGLPMREHGTNPLATFGEPDKQRATRLADTPIGTGHDNFLVGIKIGRAHV